MSRRASARSASRVAGFAVVVLAWLGFGISPPLGVLAVLLTFVLAAIVCRVAGESDIAPIGPAGKITQLVYGAIAPQQVPLNLMTAAITAGASLASADLLTDLKAGHLLGASPRRQLVAQLAGTVPGSLAACLAYAILVPDASVLTPSPAGDPPLFPAPSARQWESVARVLALGFDHLHPFAREGILVGSAIGILLAMLEELTPALRRFLPSAAGLGLGLMLPFYQPRLSRWRSAPRRPPSSAKRTRPEQRPSPYLSPPASSSARASSGSSFRR